MSKELLSLSMLSLGIAIGCLSPSVYLTIPFMVFAVIIYIFYELSNRKKMWSRTDEI